MAITVVTAIGGGLGNQMFQYAVGRRLSHVNNAELLLYLGDGYRRRPFRAYGLDRFQISARPARRGEAGGLKKVDLTRRRLAKLFPALSPEPDPDMVLERGLDFDPSILAIRRNVKLRGTWQCENYFSDISDIIRSEFTLRDQLDARNEEFLRYIKNSNSVFIHVRRGDYVTHPIDSKKFGTCSVEYYKKAAYFLADTIGKPLQYFVFSDDPDWARTMRIGGDGAKIIDWNGENPERDLALMRHCSHAIIANSTFGWWGAWLGDVTQRIVIAPRVWMQSMEHKDIVPERWIKM
jgi:hypothetical protein